jgi:hypothetical protein
LVAALRLSPLLFLMCEFPEEPRVIVDIYRMISVKRVVISKWSPELLMHIVYTSIFMSKGVISPGRFQDGCHLQIPGDFPMKIITVH